MKMQTEHEQSADLWLNTAYEVLLEGGVDAVKIMELAKRSGLTRTGFYWHFKDLNALHQALITRWRHTNTKNLVKRAGAPANNITEAMLQVFDCWFDQRLFDAALDLAIRNWARKDAALKKTLASADKKRCNAIKTMFLHHGYNEQQAEVRSMTVVYTQIGYFSMAQTDSFEKRIARVPQYVEVFTGQMPSKLELEQFHLRHTRHRPPQQPNT